jgi:hypothetical protein
MSSNDSRSVLIDSLRQNGPDFALSNVILPNAKSLSAIQALFRLREDLLNFAIDPSAFPELPLPPNEPSYEGLSEEDKEARYADYKKKFSYWLLIKDAHNRKVPLDEYLKIEEYFTPYYKTIEATSAIKGARFKAFTRQGEHQPRKQGLLGKLMGNDGDE